jgi:hypothetical protein
MGFVAQADFGFAHSFAEMPMLSSSRAAVQ